MSAKQLEDEFLEALESLVKEMGLYGSDPKAKPQKESTLKTVPPEQLQNINTMMNEKSESPKPKKPHGPKKH